LVSGAFHGLARHGALFFFLLPASTAIAASVSPRPGLRARAKSRCQWSSNEGRERRENRRSRTLEKRQGRHLCFFLLLSSSSLLFLFTIIVVTNASGRLSRASSSKSIRCVDQQHRINGLDTQSHRQTHT
jgi:hypothetical protein